MYEWWDFEYWDALKKEFPELKLPEGTEVIIESTTHGVAETPSLLKMFGVKRFYPWDSNIVFADFERGDDSE